MPKLSSIRRRRREAQQGLEQSNAWLHKRLQAIDPCAGRAYAAHAPRPPSSSNQAHEGISHVSPSPMHDRQWSEEEASSLRGRLGAEYNQSSDMSQAVPLRWDSPVPRINFASIQEANSNTLLD